MTSNCLFLSEFQESFRWISDVAVMEAFESGALDLSDFYFTGDDYRYRFEPEAKERFLDLVRERFNAGVRCKGRLLKWDSVIEEKATELGRYLVGKSRRLDFTDPVPTLSRMDGREFREKILSLSSSKAHRIGIGRSTLDYLRRNAQCEGSFRVYGKVRKRIRELA